MRILFIADVKDWVFDKMGATLSRCGTHNYTIRYRGYKYRKVFKNTDDFDLIIWPIDVRPDYLMRYRPPRAKTIVLVRSDVFKLCEKGRNVFYKDKAIANEHCCAMMCANKYLYDKIKAIHDVPTYLAPGGVDTEVFERELEFGNNDEPIVGWAGSTKFFGEKLRGLDLIKEACNFGGYNFVPAIKEIEHRGTYEMNEYYNYEITIYIDASSTAGRQNGLLEAGACGLPLVCTETGIGRVLIENNCAVKIERNINSIVEGLHIAWQKREYYGRNAERFIKKNYSWKDHVKNWEEVFGEVKRNTL